MEITVKKPRKQLIQEEAAKLFRDKGYQATSMRDIAESVGLEPSSLYSHISSKKDLLRHICFSCGALFTDGIEALRSIHSEPSEALKAIIRLHVDIAQSDVTAITVFNDEWRHLPEPDLSEFLEMRRAYEEMCLQVIEAGMRNRSFQIMDARLVLNTILSSLQWMYRSRRIMAVAPEAISQDIASIFLTGLKHSANERAN